jgi:hypothetical protein
MPKKIIVSSCWFCYFCSNARSSYKIKERMNIEQLKHANRYANQKKLGSLTDFRKGDMNAIPFPFKEAGFKIIKAEEPSATKTDTVNIEKASQEFGFIHKTINFLVKVRILPKHFITLLEQLSQNVDAFIEVDRRGLATTNYHIVAEKV